MEENTSEKLLYVQEVWNQFITIYIKWVKTSWNASNFKVIKKKKKKKALFPIFIFLKVLPECGAG